MALQGDLLVVDIVLGGFVVHSSGEMVTFDALSYTWGIPSFTQIILCNGISHPVTTNLEIALKAYRSPKEDRYIWVDALCINQQDDREKSEQVANMLAIFQKAMHVTAWIGKDEDEDDSDLVFDVVNGEEHLQPKEVDLDKKRKESITGRQL